MTDRYLWLLEFNRHAELADFEKHLIALVPELEQSPSFASKAIRSVVSTEKPTSVIVGMRKPGTALIVKSKAKSDCFTVDYVSELVGSDDGVLPQPIIAIKEGGDVHGLFAEVGKKVASNELQKVAQNLDRVLELSNKSKEAATK